MIGRYHGNETKIDACQIKGDPGKWTNAHDDRDMMENDLDEYETVLQSRLPDETFRGIFNFLKATIPDTPIDEIGKALVS